MELLCCNCFAPQKDIDWVTIISSGGAIAVGVFAIIFSYLQFKKGLEVEKIRDERKEIYKKLNDFYGPLIQLRKKSSKIYEKFSAKLRQKDPGFATLTYLLNGHKFEGNDKVLLEEIIEIGKKCEKLIHDKAGLIDDLNLQNTVIPRAITHYVVLRLAYAGALSGDAEIYKDVTFPRELDSLLEEKKKQLEERLNQLNKTE